MEILEIIFRKLLGVSVHVYVAVQLLKPIFCCLSSVGAEILSIQIELYTTFIHDTSNKLPTFLSWYKYYFLKQLTSCVSTTYIYKSNPQPVTESGQQCVLFSIFVHWF